MKKHTPIVTSIVAFVDLLQASTVCDELIYPLGGISDQNNFNSPIFERDNDKKVTVQALETAAVQQSTKKDS